MKFDSSINLGHILTVVAMLIAGTGAYTSIQVTLTEIKKDISGFQEYKLEQKKVNDKLEKKIEGLDQRIRDLELND